MTGCSAGRSILRVGHAPMMGDGMLERGGCRKKSPAGRNRMKSLQLFRANLIPLHTTTLCCAMTSIWTSPGARCLISHLCPESRTTPGTELVHSSLRNNEGSNNCSSETPQDANYSNGTVLIEH